MKHRKVRTGAVYQYEPVMMDVLHPPAGNPQRGAMLRVVRLNGCPPPGTMGHCHVNFADTGAFAGLVCCNSLQPRS